MLKQIFQAFLLLSLLVLFASTSALAEIEPLSLTNEEGSFPTRGHMELFVDASNQLTFEQVSSPAYSNKFVPIPGDLSRGVSSNTYWVRFDVILETGPEMWTLEVGPYAIDHVDVYLANKYGGFRKKSGGSLEPFYRREHPHRHLSFMYCLEYDHLKTVYIKIQSEQPITLRPVFWQPVVFKQMAKNEQIFQVGYSFISAFIVLLNLFLWWKSRKPLYGMFTLYASALTIYILNDFGFPHHYLFIEQGWISGKTTRIVGSILIYAGANVLISVLALEKHTPRIAAILKYGATSIAAVGIVLALIGVHVISGILICSSLNIGVLIGLVLAATLSIKKIFTPKTYLLAFLVLFVAFGVRTLTALGLIPDMRVLETLLTLTSVVHIILLNVGISDRVAIMKREKEN